jgi:N-acylneuraminate cytidylyltransferase
MKEKNKLMKIVCIIPARGGSKGIPRKNILDFCGKPLIAWSIEQALESQYIDKVYVSTDDKKIAEISKKYGAEIIQRPSELSTDTASSEEALLHALSIIEKQTKVDAVLFLQATSPIRESKDIDEAIETFQSQGADSLFSAAILEDFCIWKKENNILKSITFDYKNRGRRQDREPYYLENGSLYIFKPEILHKYKNRLGGKIIMYIMPYWKSFEIDTWEDIEICEYFMLTRIISKSKVIPSNEIKLIVYDFDGVMTDNKVIVNENGIESVIVNRSDGLAIDILKRQGFEQIILTTETNSVVEVRANKLGIPVLKGVKDKKNTLIEFCNERNISLKDVLYVGNDINDLQVMECVGWPICPIDASREIKKISKIVLNTRGGEGVIKEILNLIIKEGIKNED